MLLSSTEDIFGTDIQYLYGLKSGWPDSQIDVRIARCPDGQQTKSSDDQMFGWPDDQMSLWPQILMARSLDGKMTRCPDGQITRCLDDQMSGCLDDQMTKCLYDQMTKCPYGQKSRRPDIQVININPEILVQPWQWALATPLKTPLFSRNTFNSY